MKKAILSTFALLLLAFFSNAQDDGAKMAKSAGKALQSYNLSPSDNAAKLDEAREKIDKALQTAEAQALGSAWQTKGDVYATYSQREWVKRGLDPKAPISDQDYALGAFEGYKKAYEMAAKKFEKGDAIKGLVDNGIQNALLNTGGIRYEEKNYWQTYKIFKAALESHDLLKDAGKESFFDDAAQYDNYVYYTGLCAIQAGKHKEALAVLEPAIKSGKAKAEVYDAVYQSKIETGDEAGAEAVLAEGRKKFPDDTALLFAEINTYLKKGKLNELIDRLKQAIAKEPNNVGLYVTLGSVYDNLYQKALEAKDAKASDTNFEEARKCYNQAIEHDPKNADAQYSLGALYYNKAAIRTKELNEMPEDYTAAGIKKYEAFKTEIMGLFDQSLPYFQKAESLNPNDQNTLIALKEIYTRKEDDLALEFKKRLDTVMAGGKNETSHFKK